MSAAALYTSEKREVWGPTQNGEASLAAAAEAAGLPVERCEVYKLHLGGGFGRRGNFQDYVRQAVNIAKQLPGTPVKLLWWREEDMLHGAYHPTTQCRLTGALDDSGNLAALHMRISGCHAPAGSGSAIPGLVGRSAADIAADMQAFRTGARQATVMDGIAKGFTEEETRAIADWLAASRGGEDGANHADP
ncbi:hypothetical protein GCM10027514_32910 [Azotobacter armeniacus]